MEIKEQEFKRKGTEDTVGAGKVRVRGQTGAAGSPGSVSTGSTGITSVQTAQPQLVFAAPTGNNRKTRVACWPRCVCVCVCSWVRSTV